MLWKIIKLLSLLYLFIKYNKHTLIDNINPTKLSLIISHYIMYSNYSQIN
jgi:hypothetical protein